MKTSIICAVVGVVFLFFGLPPQAKSSCTNPNSILKGTYGSKVERGLIAKGAPVAVKIGDLVPFAAAGLFTFDGSGNLSEKHGTNFGGIFFQFALSGTYSVNSDCTTGTISIPAVGDELSIVIVGGGKEIKYTSTVAGTVFSGSMQLAPSACSTSTLSGGTYGYATNGLVSASLLSAGFPRVGGFVPFSNTGQIAFKLDGTVSGADNVNFGGVFNPGLPIAGTYSVNSDCTGTVALTIAGNNHSWNFVILEGADHIIFVATVTGFIWSGTLTKE